MSASVPEKKQCVTCSKSGGIMTCDGCQQSFCGKHSVEHRQELNNQLDGIMQEHDLLLQELGQSSVDNSILKQINKWEKESITKIHVAAEAARTDLQQHLDRSKERISKACYDIAVNLRSSCEADNFSENDLTGWMEQLKELKLEITSPSSIKLVDIEKLPVPLITIQDRIFTNEKPAKNKPTSILKTSALYTAQERFSQICHDVKLEEDGFVARHIGRSREYVHILGEKLYFQDRSIVRFKIGYDEDVYNIFFGCISSQAINDKTHFCSPASAGWFGYNQIYHHGNISDRGYDSSQIRTNDILSLTFDCEKQQMELYHEGVKKRSKLPIDTTKAPFPWRLLVVLSRVNDCVRILPNV